MTAKIDTLAIELDALKGKILKLTEEIKALGAEPTADGAAG